MAGEPRLKADLLDLDIRRFDHPRPNRDFSFDSLGERIGCAGNELVDQHKQSILDVRLLEDLGSTR
jgi:hypothetical protein